jgi:DNA-binding CsgD family transcriptional regulator
VFPSDAIGWNFLDRGTQTVELHGDPPELWDNAVGQLLITLDDHPVVNSYLSELPEAGLPTPRRLTDLISNRDLLKTRTHSELLRPWGVRDQLTIVTARPDEGSGSSWTLNRGGRGYTDEEVATAAFLQPLLAMTDAIWSNVHDITPNPTAKLTRREVQVLTLLSTGAKTVAVAHSYGIAQATVAKHIEHIYQKLGCRDRVTAVDFARRSGIIPTLPVASL